jgi:hypothetical protein
MPTCRPTSWLAAMASALTATLFAAVMAIADPNTLVTVPLLSSGLGTSSDLRFDRNARFAAFVSEAENLVPGQVSGGRRNVFLYDRIGGGVRLVSHRRGEPTIGGNESVPPGIAPQISADGNWVVFTSAATDLVSGQDENNAGLDVFLWNRETDTSVLVSRQATTTTVTANGESTTQGRLVGVSDNGRYVVFASSATDLIVGQAGTTFRQLYQFDRDTGNVVLVSHASSNLLLPANDRSELSSTLLEGRATSSDGRFVVFQSLARNLAPGITDGNSNFDVYLWDRDAGLASSLVLLSRRNNNPLVAGNGASTQAAISANGKFVVFLSGAVDLEGVTSDTNATVDIFRYDREGNVIELVSHRNNSATITGNGISLAPAISADGGQVAFESGATNIAVQQDDNNGVNDVFLSSGNQIALISHASGSNFQSGNGVSLQPVIDPEGGVAFSSQATDLVSGVTDTNTGFDVFFRSRSGAALFLVSHLPSETATGDHSSAVTQLFFGGGLVGFSSAARDLVDEPINGGSNLFHHGSLVMADGFESGDLTAWSQHVP